MKITKYNIYRRKVDSIKGRHFVGIYSFNEFELYCTKYSSNLNEIKDQNCVKYERNYSENK